ncbi:MAG: class I SAM-dependent methyltransferase [Spirochaetes bacterium]|nr:class I SAM-dependent methyltransferase [Spirochaetota bacterium]
MFNGIIEGKKARIYDKKIHNQTKIKIFNDFILSNINFNSKLNICDICCGSGVSIDILKDKDCNILGIDGSYEMIKICNEKFNEYNNIKLIQSLVSKVDLKPNSYDYIILRQGLHHIKNKLEIINKIYSALKYGGKLILIDKYYKSKYKYFLYELLRLIFKFDAAFTKHVIISEKKHYKLLKNFYFNKKVIINEINKKKPTQSFMFLVEKC